MIDKERYSDDFARDIAAARRTLLSLRQHLRMQLPSDLLQLSMCPCGLPEKLQDSPTLHLRLAEAERVLLQLREVEDSLNRLDSDDFGICLKCGREIEERLLRKALTSKTCASCK